MPIMTTTQAFELSACLVQAGILRPEEGQLLTSQPWQYISAAEALSPSLLTRLPGQGTPAALRWEWDCRRAAEFAAWAMAALQERFSITWRIEGEEEDLQLGPRYLRLHLGAREERCDWRYLNQHRWMEAFCTIANRLLEPVRVTALDLETGWFDTIVCFCWRDQVEALLRWFPEAE